MSNFTKILGGVTLAAGTVAIFTFCPAASAALWKVVALSAPSVCEIIDERGYWPLF